MGAYFLKGDFNKVLALSKVDGKDNPMNQVWAFQEVEAKVGLVDFSLEGGTFTWSNRREEESCTRVQLDRNFSNFTWTSLFM